MSDGSQCRVLSCVAYFVVVVFSSFVVVCCLVMYCVVLFYVVVFSCVMLFSLLSAGSESILILVVNFCFVWSVCLSVWLSLCRLICSRTTVTTRRTKKVGLRPSLPSFTVLRFVVLCYVVLCCLIL
jgi:hypothetical protein